MSLPQPLLLRLEFAFELEKANHIVGQVIRSLHRKMWKCGYGKRSIALVVVTEESSLELVKRLQLDSFDAIEDYFCHTAPIGAICKHGSFNTLHTVLNQAWEHVGQRSHPEYMRQTKRFDPRVERRVEDRESGAIREMRVKPASMREAPQNPYRPKR